MNKIIIIYENGETRQEIGEVEVPEGAKELRYGLYAKGLVYLISDRVCIPKPTKKVWKWETLWGNHHLVSDHSELPPVPLDNGCHWRKLAGSEEEVEA